MTQDFRGKNGFRHHMAETQFYIKMQLIAIDTESHSDLHLSIQLALWPGS